LVVEPLIAALDDDTEVCRAAAEALGKLHAQRAAAPLLERLRHADDLFLDLADAIGVIGDLTVTTEMLCESLRLGRLVPFVGPDFPHTLTGLPNRATVARELAQREHLSENESLAEIAVASMRGSPNRYTFTSFLKRRLNDQLIGPGEMHRALAGLGANFWISGTYDTLLPRALGANVLVSGSETRYWQGNRPTVLLLAGDLSRPDSLLVVEDDYEHLRKNEGDRKLLVSYLRNELSGKVVLFLGYDPNSPDFDLLVRYVLNIHLAGVNVRAFLVWPQERQSKMWNQHQIHRIKIDQLDVVHQLRGEILP
jgi:hypothetical protein